MMVLLNLLAKYKISPLTKRKKHSIILFLTGAKLRNSNKGGVMKKAQSFRFLAQNDSYRHLHSVFT